MYSAPIVLYKPEFAYDVVISGFRPCPILDIAKSLIRVKPARPINEDGQYMAFRTTLSIPPIYVPMVANPSFQVIRQSAFQYLSRLAPHLSVSRLTSPGSTFVF